VFNSYLDNAQSYADLEQHLYELFHSEAQVHGLDAGKFKVPYCNTKFADGTPCQDGNPIFSARNESNGQILRIVLDEDIATLVSYSDKEMNCELVLVGKVALLDEIKKLMRKWIRSQHSGLHVASAVTE
jgi:hypothetical protein